MPTNHDSGVGQYSVIVKPSSQWPWVFWLEQQPSVLPQMTVIVEEALTRGGPGPAFTRNVLAALPGSGAFAAAAAKTGAGGKAAMAGGGMAAAVAKGGAGRASRYMLVTQQTVGEDTVQIRQRAPRTWAYLNTHADQYNKDLYYLCYPCSPYFLCYLQILLLDQLGPYFLCFPCFPSDTYNHRYDQYYL